MLGGHCGESSRLDSRIRSIGSLLALRGGLTRFSSGLRKVVLSPLNAPFSAGVVGLGRQVARWARG